MLSFSRVLRAPENEPFGGSLRLAALNEHHYRGERRPDGICSVLVEDRGTDGATTRIAWRELPLHLEIRAHSPSGFAWGYGGSGPAQLALALLVDALGDRELAERHYVSKWEDNWSITACEIRSFVAEQEKSSGGVTKFARLLETKRHFIPPRHLCLDQIDFVHEPVFLRTEKGVLSLVRTAPPVSRSCLPAKTSRAI
jgi:hypothetical protein